MGEEKHSLRARLLRQRESLSVSEVNAWSRQIQERVLRFLPYVLCRSVVLYSPVGNEVNTETIRDHALTTGKKLFYPRLKPGKSGTLGFAQVESTKEFERGRYGILEPAGTKGFTKQDEEASVVLVPGLAFDPNGNRLGRGGGWYDRALSSLGDGPKIVALAYEIQIVPQLRVHRWDRKVDDIITEKRIIHCGEPLRRPRCFLSIH